MAALGFATALEEDLEMVRQARSLPRGAKADMDRASTWPRILPP